MRDLSKAFTAHNLAVGAVAYSVVTQNDSYLALGLALEQIAGQLCRDASNAYSIAGTGVTSTIPFLTKYLPRNINRWSPLLHLESAVEVFMLWKVYGE